MGLAFASVMLMYLRACFASIGCIPYAREQWPMTLGLVTTLVVVWLLTFIFIYDARHQEILDRTTLLPAVILFFFSALVGWKSVQTMLLGVFIGAGFFYLQYALTKGKGIGGGDIRLGALMGVILGWPGILVALLVSYVLGAVVGLYLLILKRKKMNSTVPLGTFLCIGTCIAMFWGRQIAAWYVGLL